jgi:hypoxanthine phosphoribosyltransferase
MTDEQKIVKTLKTSGLSDATKNLGTVCRGLTHVTAETAKKLVEKTSIEPLLRNSVWAIDFSDGVCRGLSLPKPEIADMLIDAVNIDEVVKNPAYVDNFVETCSHLMPTYRVPEKVLYEEVSSMLKATNADELLRDATKTKDFVLKLDENLNEKMAAILGERIIDYGPRVDFSLVADLLPASYEEFFGKDIPAIELPDWTVTVSAKDGGVTVRLEKEGTNVGESKLISYSKKKWKISFLSVNEAFRGREYSAALLDLCVRIAEKYGAEEIIASSATVAGFVVYRRGGFLPARFDADGKVEVHEEQSDALDKILEAAGRIENRRERILYYNSKISGLLKDEHFFDSLIKTPAGFFVHYPKGRMAPAEEKATAPGSMDWMLFEAARDLIDERFSSDEELEETLLAHLNEADLGGVKDNGELIAAIYAGVVDGFLAHMMAQDPERLKVFLGKHINLKRNELDDAAGLINFLHVGGSIAYLREVGYSKRKLAKYSKELKAAGVWGSKIDSGPTWSKLADVLLSHHEKIFLSGLKEELEKIAQRESETDHAPAAKEEFRCEMMSAGETEELAKRISRYIAKDCKPDVIVAVARGGLIPAMMLAKNLGGVEVLSTQVTHWNKTGEKNREGAELDQGLPADLSLSGKKVLVVDDITDTGDSLVLAVKEVRKHAPADVRTATLIHKQQSAFTPDYFGKKTEAWKWIVLPWNVREDFMNLRKKVGGEGMDVDGVLKIFEDELGLLVDKKAALEVFDGKVDISGLTGKHGLEADMRRAHATAEKVRADDYVPEVLVGLGDRGLELMMMLSDALDVKTVRHVPIGGEVAKYLRRRDFGGKRVLVVGDFENKVAVKRLLDGVWEYAADVRTACLETKKTPEFVPDYYPTKRIEARSEDEPELAPDVKAKYFTEQLLKWGRRNQE